jgi:hypothetical protein
MTFDLVSYRKQLRQEISRLQTILDACMVKPMEVKFRAVLPCPARRGLTKGVKLGHRANSIQVRAIAWLRAYLSDGKSHDAGKVIAAAERAGFKTATFNIASRRAGVIKTKNAPSAPWKWKL